MEKKTKWLDKPYNNLNTELRSVFGEKIIKLSVDGGFSCPNRDGQVSTGGCIFCSEQGSGDFAGCRQEPIEEQLRGQIDLLKDKWPKAKYIAYFQSFSNTYGDIEQMETKFRQALSMPGVVGLAIATRADCIDEQVINLLDCLNHDTYLWVEMGLQSVYDHHHKWLNTGYTPAQFAKAVRVLANKDIQVVGHLIVGLPDTPETFLEDTTHFFNELPIKGLKIHMLNVLKNTDLAGIYDKELFDLMDEVEYINLLVKIIERLKQTIVIHRVTGDGAKDLLIAPKWILNKRKVLNDLLKAFKMQETYQGKLVD